jgi:hypothetical protein
VSDERSVQERADEAMALIHEISRDEAFAAEAKAYANLASHAILQITNRLHDQHQHEAAMATSRCWNLFVQVIQPLWMDGPCTNPEHQAADQANCYCCSCEFDGDGHLMLWAADCRLHGAHGEAACEKHNLPAVRCDCGCDDEGWHADRTESGAPRAGSVQESPD